MVRPGFLFSFYFWLDSVAVLSLAFELPALRAVLLLGETQVGTGLATHHGLLSSCDTAHLSAHLQCCQMAA